MARPIHVETSFEHRSRSPGRRPSGRICISAGTFASPASNTCPDESAPQRFLYATRLGDVDGQMLMRAQVHLSVDEQTRGLRLRSGEQRFYERRARFRFPMTSSGYADVCECESERFRIQVEVRNPRWGRLFGYRGSFTVERIAEFGEVPPGIKPIREERRE
jgi:hypothetical protein